MFGSIPRYLGFEQSSATSFLAMPYAKDDADGAARGLTLAIDVRWERAMVQPPRLWLLTMHGK
jgi:hypothetical protein|tara:strand:- start:457 stop:645 length:189 start_codon:yes stop_codon:yes gene_type:complete